MAEREGFEPSVPFWGTHDFQSCAFNRSATSPYWNIENLRALPRWFDCQCLQNVSTELFWVVLLSCCFQKLTQAFAVAKTECEKRDFTRLRWKEALIVAHTHSPRDQVNCHTTLGNSRRYSFVACPQHADCPSWWETNGFKAAESCSQNPVQAPNIVDGWGSR